MTLGRLKKHIHKTVMKEEKFKRGMEIIKKKTLKIAMPSYSL